MLIAMAGLPGTGKSSLAGGLAAVLSGVVLDKDLIRAALFPPEVIAYSAEQDDFCQGIMLQVADYLLQREPRKIVILDGRPFARRYQRAALVGFAEARGYRLAIIECVCSEETARRRLERGAAMVNHPAANRDYALYRRLKAQFEPIEEPRLVINTDGDSRSCLDRALSYVRDREAMGTDQWVAPRSGSHPGPSGT